MEPTRSKLEEKAIELDTEGKCIICEEERANRRRGLCVKHYEQFRRRRDSLLPFARADWERLSISRGKLLPSKQGQRQVTDDAFSDLFDEFQALHGPDVVPVDLDPDVEDAVAQTKAAARQIEAEKASKKRVTKKKKRGSA